MVNGRLMSAGGFWPRFYAEQQADSRVSAPSHWRLPFAIRAARRPPKFLRRRKQSVFQHGKRWIASAFDLCATANRSQLALLTITRRPIIFNLSNSSPHERSDMRGELNPDIATLIRATTAPAPSPALRSRPPLPACPIAPSETSPTPRCPAASSARRFPSRRH